MPGTSHDRCRAEHSLSEHGALLIEHQRARASWTVLPTHEGKFERIMICSSDVLTAEAKKTERASEDTRLIPTRPSGVEDWLGSTEVAKVRITNSRDAPTEKVALRA